jgi:ABC-type transport system involved in cytochrome c biogenesis permease component
MASLLAMIQALAIRANGGFGLIAVLGLPLIIPVILIATQYGLDILNGVSFADTAHNLLFLATLSGGFGALGYILFPYLWSD